MSETPPGPASEGPTPQISVILPAYNRAALLGRAIESVLAQTFADLELIVVDDASTDGTAAVIKGYAARDPRVRSIRSQGNLGGGGARNLGVTQARAPLIAFQDSDDRWLPEKLARQRAALEAAPQAGLAYCGSLYFGPGPQGEGQGYYIPEPVFAHLSGDMSVEVLRRNPTSTQTLLMRRTLFDRVGGFDPSFRRLQDWDLMVRLAQITRFAFTPEPLVIIYETPGNISSSVHNDAVFRARMLEKYADLFARHPDLAARQNHVVGRHWTGLGEARRALPPLWRALTARPSLRGVAALGVAALHAVLRAVLRAVLPAR